MSMDIDMHLHCFINKLDGFVGWWACEVAANVAEISRILEKIVC